MGFEKEPYARSSGTTATVAVLNGKTRRCAVAHAGDSSLLVAHSPHRYDFCTEDHDFNQADMARCAACGGEVKEFPTVLKVIRRVYAKGQKYPALALARSLGDTDAHAIGVIAEPEVRENLALEAGGVLVLASDGVWNAISKDRVVQLALQENAQTAADFIISEALSKWPSVSDGYTDDISCIVVKAKPGNASPCISLKAPLIGGAQYRPVDPAAIRNLAPRPSTLPPAQSRVSVAGMTQPSAQQDALAMAMNSVIGPQMLPSPGMGTVASAAVGPAGAVPIRSFRDTPSGSLREVPATGSLREVSATGSLREVTATGSLRDVPGTGLSAMAGAGAYTSGFSSACGTIPGQSGPALAAAGLVQPYPYTAGAAPLATPIATMPITQSHMSVRR